MTTIVKHQNTMMGQHLSPQPDTTVEIMESCTSTSDTPNLSIEVMETPAQERQAWVAASLGGLDRWEEQHRR